MVESKGEAVRKIKKLKNKEEALYRGESNPLTQGEAEKQTQINNRIEEIEKKYGLDAGNIQAESKKIIEGETDSGGTVEVRSDTVTDPSSGEPTQIVVTGTSGTKQGKSNVEKVQEAAKDQGYDEVANTIQNFQDKTDEASLRPSGVSRFKLSGVKRVETETDQKMQDNQDKQDPKNKKTDSRDRRGPENPPGLGAGALARYFGGPGYKGLGFQDVYSPKSEDFEGTETSTRDRFDLFDDVNAAAASKLFRRTSPDTVKEAKEPFLEGKDVPGETGTTGDFLTESQQKEEILGGFYQSNKELWDKANLSPTEVIVVDTRDSINAISDAAEKTVGKNVDKIEDLSPVDVPYFDTSKFTTGLLTEPLDVVASGVGMTASASQVLKPVSPDKGFLDVNKPSSGKPLVTPEENIIPSNKEISESFERASAVPGVVGKGVAEFSQDFSENPEATFSSEILPELVGGLSAVNTATEGGVRTSVRKGVSDTKTTLRKAKTTTDKVVDEFIDTDVIASGVGAAVPEETSPAVEPTETVTVEQGLDELEIDPLDPETIPQSEEVVTVQTPGPSTAVVAGETETPSNPAGAETMPRGDTVPEDVSIDHVFDEAMARTEAIDKDLVAPTATSSALTASSSLSEAISLAQTTTSSSETTTTTSTSSSRTRVDPDEEKEEDRLFPDPFAEEELEAAPTPGTEAAPSLNAVLFDIEGDLQEDEVFTGLETRPTEEDLDPFP